MMFTKSIRKMEFIETQNTFVEIGNIEDSTFQSIVKNYRKIAILVDENTSILLPKVAPLITHTSPTIITIKSGEQEKKLTTCEFIWTQLIEQQFNRNDLFVNLGGGVITDLGGFVASIYKRGIDFINIPTSLLSMVDASVGGKTGINFLSLKNNIGLFIEPKGVFCDSRMLTTLPKDELTSGVGEVLKHGILFDQQYWNYCVNTPLNEWDWNYIIKTSIQLKNTIVNADPFEQNERKKLNFGHTIGHAIESYFMNTSSQLLHGEAVAIGIICESYIAFKKNRIDTTTLTEITQAILDLFKHQQLPTDHQQLIALMLQDKKNENLEINFTLIEAIGKSSINHTATIETIVEALNFYTNLNQ